MKSPCSFRAALSMAPVMYSLKIHSPLQLTVFKGIKRVTPADIKPIRVNVSRKKTFSAQISIL